MTSIPRFRIIDPDDWRFPGNVNVVRDKVRARDYYSTHGTYEGAADQIEEFVRQWTLDVLITHLGYPAEWIGERIVIEEPVKIGSATTEADIAIRNDRGKPFIYVETKTRGSTHKEFAEAKKRLESCLAATHTATIGMVTDGDQSKAIRKKVDPNDFEYIPNLPRYRRSHNPIQTHLVRTIPAGVSRASTGLKTIEDTYEKILLDCHDSIRDIDGLHADEALDELCKIIFAKTYDETVTTSANRDTAAFRFQTYGTGNASEVASIIRTLYQDATDENIRLCSQRTPNYERSRGVFRQPIKLSDIALSAIVERLQGYSFIDSKADFKGRAFQTVLAPAIRSGMGQYFTPDPIVELAVLLTQPKVSDTILDPFCGSGHFLTKALSYVVKHQASYVSNHELSKFKTLRLHGIEKSERMVRIAMTDMLLHDDGHTNIRNTDSLLSFDNYPDLVFSSDDLGNDHAIFDIVLTNPPFGSVMKGEALDMLGRFELRRKRKSLPLEVLGLERSIQFLKPGGRLAIVLPEHLLNGKTNRYVREWLFEVCEMKAMISFPEDAFAPFGAMVKTCLCVLRKLRKSESLDTSSKVFLCGIGNLGYDSTGRSKPGSEITEAADQFHSQVGW